MLSISPGQLWFLLVLFECVLIVLVARALALRLLGRERCARLLTRVGGVLSSPVGVLLAAVPYAAGLLLQDGGVGGIQEPVTLVPSVSALTAYLGAFLVGWALHAEPAAMARIARGWPAYLGTAVALTLVSVAGAATLPAVAAAAATALAGWTWTYALLGLCVRFLSAERPAIRYLADASYWMYLAHLPLLIGFEILLVPLDWPVPVKLALTLVVVGAALLVSYHLLVRSTPIGRWLNGRRHPFRWPWSGARTATESA